MRNMTLIFGRCIDSLSSSLLNIIVPNTLIVSEIQLIIQVSFSSEVRVLNPFTTDLLKDRQGAFEVVVSSIKLPSLPSLFSWLTARSGLCRCLFSRCGQMSQLRLQKLLLV